MALLLLSMFSWAQDGKLGYQFLHIPVSAHSAALGGANISIVEDDASMMWTNAAMLTNVSDNSIMLGYNSYIRSSNLMSAGYTKAIGERGTWALLLEWCHCRQSFVVQLCQLFQHCPWC